jgi:hypothetical protein
MAIRDLWDTLGRVQAVGLRCDRQACQGNLALENLLDVLKHCTPRKARLPSNCLNQTLFVPPRESLQISLARLQY